MAASSTNRPAGVPVNVARAAGKALRLWHLTSLDAPTVAVVWALAFAWASGIRLPLWVLAVLALGCWSVYIGDRLLDARSAKSPLRPRHHFHWRHRRIFLPLAASSLAASLTLVAIAVAHHQMPMAARERNSILAAAALMYFSSVHTPWRAAKTFRLPKELLVGVLFTLACALPTVSRGPLGPVQLLAVSALVALAWLNCHAIDRWESSLHASVFRVAALLTILPGMAGIGFLAAGLHRRTGLLLLAAALSAGLLALLDRSRHWQRDWKRDRRDPTTLRAAADLVLLTPLLLLTLAPR